MANYRKSFNFRNGVQVDNDNFIVNPNGLVGIGTSVPTELLDVRGTVTASMFHANASADAGSPEYSFGTDPDTGMYSGGANVLGFSTGGTVRLSLTTAVLTSQVTGGARLGIGNGSDAAPTFTFNDDADTGMFRGAANQLGFTTGGTEKVRIVGTGEVGIGTTTPEAIGLHIQKASTDTSINLDDKGHYHLVLQNNDGASQLSLIHI